MINLNDSSELVRVEVELIEPNPWQPRKTFNNKELEELKESISQEGVLQPLVLSLHPFVPQKYYVIAGERRLRAAKLAGLSRVPATVINLDPTKDDQLRLALIENIQRSNLNIIEEGRAYRALIERFGYTQEDCSKRVGKDRVTITNALRILNLPEEIHEDLISGRLSAGHARALVGLHDRLKILRMRDVILARQLSVRETENLCKKTKKGGATEEGLGIEDSLPEPNAHDPDLRYIQESIQSHLGVRVQIRGNLNLGRIELTYLSADEFERLWKVLLK